LFFLKDIKFTSNNSQGILSEQLSFYQKSVAGEIEMLSCIF
jgi:hypothetical protein